MMKAFLMHIARYLVLLIFAAAMGGVLGGILGFVSFTISGGGGGLGISFGSLLGSVCGVFFYGVVHWIVFRIPLERTATYLIGGTLIGGVPLSVIPMYGPIWAIYGGISGYWIGVFCLLFQLWREKHGYAVRHENLILEQGFWRLVDLLAFCVSDAQKTGRKLKKGG